LERYRGNVYIFNRKLNQINGDLFMENKYIVLHIGEYTKGGIATYLQEVLEYQTKEKNISKIVVLSSNNTDLNKEILNSNKKITTIYYNYKRSVLGIFKAALIVNRTIKKYNPDIIHIHSTFAGFFTRILFFFKRRKTKVIYCSHGWAFLMEINKIKKFIYIGIEKILSFHTDSIINISKYEQNYSIEYGIQREKSVLINNGIKKEKNSINYELPLSYNPTQINLLFIGRYDRQKGVDFLIDFFNKYSIKNVSLFTAGEVVVSNNKNFNVMRNNITNLGKVEHSKIDNLISKMDAIIIPSRWEGFGLVAIEAMKNSKAVIVSDRGALPELVLEGYNGYVFKFGDFESLLKIIESLDKNKLKLLGENGKKFFEKKYTSDIMNGKIIELYNSLMLEKDLK
jgi:glycosyltransferase involved in cell wall biosynthesis